MALAYKRTGFERSAYGEEGTGGSICVHPSNKWNIAVVRGVPYISQLQEPLPPTTRSVSIDDYRTADLCGNLDCIPFTFTFRFVIPFYQSFLMRSQPLFSGKLFLAGPLFSLCLCTATTITYALTHGKGFGAERRQGRIAATSRLRSIPRLYLCPLELHISQSA
jgi:hypothetical protein